MTENFERFDPQALMFNLGFDQRLDTLQRALKEARDLQRTTSQDSWGKHRLATQIGKLEAAIENEGKQRVSWAEYQARQEAEQAQAERMVAARIEMARAAQEERDRSMERTIYRITNPGGTDADFERDYPGIVATKAASKREELIAAARTKYVV